MVADCDRCCSATCCSPRCKTRGAVTGKEGVCGVQERHASLRHRLPRLLRRRTDAFGHDRLVQGGVKNCAEIHAPTHVGMSRFRSRRRLWIPNLCSRVVLRERAPEGKRASMRQALLVKLRWSLVFRPCVCRERLPDEDMDGGGRRCFSANHGTRVPGRHGMCDPGFGPGLSA